jgi:hypothetical protein
VATFALAASPASAAGAFNVFGSWWDTDQADKTGGGGIAFALPVGRGWGVDLRASYHEELTNEPLEALFDENDPVFQRTGLQVMPLEAGLRYNFAPGNRTNFYLGGGGSYHVLDSDFGNVDDEVGGYALAGIDFGNPAGLSFFVEGIYRFVEATVEIDPQDLDDFDDIEGIENGVGVDLNGVGLNIGMSWRFGGGARG